MDGLLFRKNETLLEISSTENKMYILYSFFWFVSASGNFGMASHDIVPNLTEQQCLEMKEYVIEKFEKENIKKDNEGSFFSSSSNYTVECKKVQE